MVLPVCRIVNPFGIVAVHIQHVHSIKSPKKRAADAALSVSSPSSLNSRRKPHTADPTMDRYLERWVGATVLPRSTPSTLTPKATLDEQKLRAEYRCHTSCCRNAYCVGQPDRGHQRALRHRRAKLGTAPHFRYIPMERC